MFFWPDSSGRPQSEFGHKLQRAQEHVRRNMEPYGGLQPNKGSFLEIVWFFQAQLGKHVKHTLGKLVFSLSF